MSDIHTLFVREQTVLGRAPLVPEIALQLATEVTPLWQATEATLACAGLPPPFWAFAWPGGQALARLLLDQPEWVKGRSVLDFAAGGGIAGIAAAKAGATIVAVNEIDDFALAAIRLNAAANRVTLDVVDRDLLATPAAGDQVILCGDVCYERPMAERVLAWLAASVAKGAVALVADPGRAYLPRTGLEEVACYDVPTSLDLENRTLMTTKVYRFLTL